MEVFLSTVTDVVGSPEHDSSTVNCLMIPFLLSLSGTHQCTVSADCSQSTVTLVGGPDGAVGGENQHSNPNEHDSHSGQTLDVHSVHDVRQYMVAVGVMPYNGS